MVLRCAAVLVLAAVSALPAACIQLQDLQAFLRSPTGLAMAPIDAANLASKEVNSLTICGITVPILQALKDAMYSPSMLNLGMVEVRQNLLPLAYQHASPAKLNSLYQTLYSVRGLGMPLTDAQTNALDLAMRHAEPDLLGPLFKVLYMTVGLARIPAQQMALNLTAAGADAAALSTSYLDAMKRMSKDAALNAAVAAAVVANLYGLPGRYARDGKLYVAKEFQTFYGAQWLAEWQAGPQEKRTADDGKDYRAAEYFEHYGSTWNAKWATSPIAVLRRVSPDGKVYTMEDFQKYYTNSWQAQWFKAYEVLDLCAGLLRPECDAQSTKCQWLSTGDQTTSCVVRPLTPQELLVL